MLLRYFTYFRHYFSKTLSDASFVFHKKDSFKSVKLDIKHWVRVDFFDWSKVASRDFLSNNWNNAYKENRIKGGADRDRWIYQYSQVWWLACKRVVGWKDTQHFPSTVLQQHPWAYRRQKFVSLQSVSMPVRWPLYPAQGVGAILRQWNMRKIENEENKSNKLQGFCGQPQPNMDGVLMLLQELQHLWRHLSPEDHWIASGKIAV